MGTRCGEVDPAIIPFLMDKEDMTGKQVYQYLNNKSGVLGISGLSSDFRDLEKAAGNGDERAILAMDIFAYRVGKYIGAYAVAMGGLDAVVFTAGLGENSPVIREKVCEKLEFMGTRLDKAKNLLRDGIREISAEGCQVKLLVIPTNEELVIAKDTERICKNIVFI